MSLNQVPENTREIPCTRPPSCPAGDSGHRRLRPHPRPRRKEMTTNDDLFAAAFGKFSVNSIGYVNGAAGNDDFMTTQ